MFVMVKNTFIEVVMASECTAPRRQHSCPPQSHQSKGPGCDSDRTWMSTTHFIPTCAASIQDKDSHGESARETAVTKEPGKKRYRPCKGKRLRYKRFVERLHMQVAMDGESFNMDQVLWPPSLQADDKKRQKLIRCMENFHHQINNGERGC